MLIQFLLRLDRQPAHAPIIEIGGQARRFIRLLARDLVLLPLDVTLVFALDFDLLGDQRVVDRRTRSRQRHQCGIRDARPPQQILQRVFALDALPQHALAFVLRNYFRVDPTRFETLALARHRFTLALEMLPAQIIDDAEPTSDFGQPHVGVVFAQTQTILSAAGKHPIRLGHAARDQIIDQHAEISFVATRTPPGFARDKTRGVNAGEQSLRRGLFIAGGAVDLARKKQSFDRFGLERTVQSARIKIIVFDCITGARDVCPLESFDRAHQRELNIKRQAGRYAIGIKLLGRQPFRLEENLVRSLVRETRDLVFDRRAIPRAYACDSTGEQRRAVEPAADDLVRALVGVCDPARQLLRVLMGRAEKGKHRAPGRRPAVRPVAKNQYCGRRCAAACRS